MKKATVTKDIKGTCYTVRWIEGGKFRSASLTSYAGAVEYCKAYGMEPVVIF